MLQRRLSLGQELEGLNGLLELGEAPLVYLRPVFYKVNKAQWPTLLREEIRGEIDCAVVLVDDVELEVVLLLLSVTVILDLRIRELHCHLIISFLIIICK